MWYLLTGFLCIFLVLISGEAVQKNRRAKATQKAIVEEFLQCAQKIKKSTMIETNVKSMKMLSTRGLGTKKGA